MPKLLHIEASSRKERSHSIEIARLSLEGYRQQAYPTDEVETTYWKLSFPNKWSGY